MNEEAGSPGSDGSSGFLSWDRSQRSAEYQVSRQQRLSQPHGSQNPPQWQQQQQQQQQSNPTQQPPYIRTHSQEPNESSISSHSPTPFRPMQPKEFSLGSNLRRLHPTMPLPTLPADVSRGVSPGRGAGPSQMMSSTWGMGRGSSNGRVSPSTDHETDTAKGRTHDMHQDSTGEEIIKVPLSDEPRRSSLYSKATSGRSSMGRISEEDSSGVSSGFSASLRNMDETGTHEGEVVGDLVVDMMSKAYPESKPRASEEGKKPGDKPRPPAALTSSHQSSASSKVSSEYVIEDVAKSSASLKVYEVENRGDSAEDYGDNDEYIMGTIEEAKLPPSNKSSPDSQGKQSKQSSDGGGRPDDMGQSSFKTPSGTPYKPDLKVDTLESAAVPQSIENAANTPMSVSTISPHERFHPSLKSNQNDPSTTATARFGRLLAECRELTETCGDSVTLDSSDQNTNRDSSYRGSSHPTTSSRQETTSSSSDNRPVKIASALQLRAKAVAAAAANSDTLEARRFAASPAVLQQEIDTADELKVSNLTMDPSILSSMRSSGFNSSLNPDYAYTSRGSMNFRASTELQSSEFRPSTFQQSALQPFEEDESSKEPSVTMEDVGGPISVPTKDDPSIDTPAQQSQRQMRNSDAVSKSAISDISLGVDMMYGDMEALDEFDLEELANRSSRSPMDDETASFNPSKFLMNAMALEKSSRSVDEVSDVSMSEREGHRMMMMKAETKGQSPEQMPPRADEEAKEPSKVEPMLSPKEEMASPAPSRAFRPQEETAARYSWLSYTTNNDDTPKQAKTQDDSKVEVQVIPTKSSPLASDELHIPNNNRRMSNAGSAHSTEFTEDSGGLLVGFGHRRKIVVPSEASSISSSDSSSGSSSGSAGSSSYESRSSGSSSSPGSSGSSSSSGDLSSSSEESMNIPGPIARDGLHIPSSRDSVGDDMVSELSFGGASALMALQSQAARASFTRGQGRMEAEGTAPGSSHQSSSPDNSDIQRINQKNIAGAGERQPLGSSPSTQRPQLPSRELSRRASMEAQLTLEKLDEVSESNASFLDDITSIDGDNNQAVKQFLSDPAPSDVWSSFASSKDGSTPPISSPAANVRRMMSQSSRNSSSMISRESIQEEKLAAVDSEDVSISSSSSESHSAMPNAMSAAQHPPGIQRSNSNRSNSTNSDLPHASVSSGSYYDGVVARAAAMESASGTDVAGGIRRGSMSSRSSSRAPSTSSSHGIQFPGYLASGSGAQKAGIKTTESIRSAASIDSASRSNGDDARGEPFVHRPQQPALQQGSGESPLENIRRTSPVENIHPNVDDVSSMSSVVSKARESFSRELPTAFASAEHQSADAVSRSSKASGLSEQKPHGRIARNLKSDLSPGVHDTTDIAVGTAGVAEGSHSFPTEKELNHELALSMMSGDDEPCKGDLYEDFPPRCMDDDDDDMPRQRSSLSQMVVPADLETDARKPWKTAPRTASASVDLASSAHEHSQENLMASPSASPGKVDPEEDVEKQPEMDDGASDGMLSELFESKEALRQIGLYESVVADPYTEAATPVNASIDNRPEPVMERSPGVTGVHKSRSSNCSSSSSITEWDFTKPPSSNDRDTRDAISQHSHRSIVEEEQPELLETSQDESEASSQKIEHGEEESPKRRSSIKLLADTADEMTNRLRRSFASRQMTNSDIGSLDTSESEKSVNDILESLKTFQKSLGMEVRSVDSSPPASEEGGNESDNEFELQKDLPEHESPVDDEEEDGLQRPATISSMAVEVSATKDLDDEAKGSEKVSHPFRRRRFVPDTVDSSDSDNESGKVPRIQQQKSSQRNPHSSMLGYSVIDSEGLDMDDSDHEEKMQSSNKKAPNPNPFLDEEFDEAEFDEEYGLPPDAAPFSISDADEEDAGRGDNGDNDAKKLPWYQCKEIKHRKWLCLIAAAVIVVIIAIVVGVEVARSRNEPADDEPSNPAVKPPSTDPQTSTPPTRLPTPLPTSNTVPNWVQVGGDLVGESPGDEAGFSVSVSENGRVIVGARRNAKDGMKNRGAARIFEFNSKTGFYAPVFDIYGEAAGDQCGFSVSMSQNGKRVAVGSLGNDKNGQNSGQVRIFDENEFSKTWNLVAELNGEAETSLFGASVSLSHEGSNLVVGAPYHSEGDDMTRSGRSYVYREVQESRWEQVGQPMLGTSSNDLFGWSVSFLPNAQYLAVGAPGLEGQPNYGYVKVFSSASGTGWTLDGEPMSMGVPGDRFGFSVSLAGGDALKRLAIGAPGMNIKGDGSGLASIYENDGTGGWLRSSDDLLGDSWGENLGYAVSLTPDGSRMAVGVPNKKLDGVPVGQLRVADVQSGTLRSAGNIVGRDGDKFGVSVAVSYEGKLVYGGASAANLVRAFGDMYR